jgi:hypothetical protein
VLVITYLGLENVTIAVVEYDEKLLLPLFDGGKQVVDAYKCRRN